MHLYLLPTLQLHNTLMLEVLKLPQWALIGVDGKNLWLTMLHQVAP